MFIDQCFVLPNAEQSLLSLHRNENWFEIVKNEIPNVAEHLSQVNYLSLICKTLQCMICAQAWDHSGHYLSQDLTL